MSKEEKKYVWMVDVNRMSALKVVFSKPVTRDEAIGVYLDGDYDDIIDEEDHGVEVVGAH